MDTGIVISVSKSKTHTLKKENEKEINLITGMGVEGDAHMGKTVKHRSRVAKDPKQPNLRQVHLISSELHEELQLEGFDIQPGEMGENITTKGIDLINLPTNTILKIGTESKIRITGLRNPCNQLESIQKGLMKAVLDKDENGQLIRKAGIMAVVVEGGIIKVGDKIGIEFPGKKPFKKLERV